MPLEGYKGLDVGAVQALMPQPASEAPKPEGGSAQRGATLGRFAMEDHQHPRLTSAQVGTLDSAGKATIMFQNGATPRTFASEPAISMMAVENDTKSPPDFKVMQFLDDVGQPWAAGKPYGGAIVYGTRARALPGLNAVTDLLGGVVSKLTGFVPNEPAAGVKFSIIALQQSA